MCLRMMLSAKADLPVQPVVHPSPVVSHPYRIHMMDLSLLPADGTFLPPQTAVHGSFHIVCPIRDRLRELDAILYHIIQNHIQEFPGRIDTAAGQAEIRYPVCSM